MVQAIAGATATDPGTGDAGRTASGSGPGEGMIVPPINPLLPLPDHFWPELTAEQRKNVKVQQLTYADAVCAAAAAAYKAIAAIVSSG
jgi:hypothetical protein